MISHTIGAVVSRKIRGICLPIAALIALASPLTHAATGKVLVAAPSIVNADPQYAWLAPAFQQSLVADLTRHLKQPVEAADIPANDSITAARHSGGQRLVVGSIQVAGEQIRFTGQVIDVEHNRVMVALKVTGQSSDLFEMEDQLSAQAVHALTPPAAASGTPHPMPVIVATGPLQLNLAPDKPGMQYVRPYVNDRFSAAENRRIYGSPSDCCGWYGGGCGWGWGGGCGFRGCGFGGSGFGFHGGLSAYPTASFGYVAY